jgi:hypothetical protein
VTTRRREAYAPVPGRVRAGGRCGSGPDASDRASAGMFAPSSLLVAGFGPSAMLWTAPLALRRVREAA